MALRLASINLELRDIVPPAISLFSMHHADPRDPLPFHSGADLRPWSTEMPRHSAARILLSGAAVVVGGSALHHGDPVQGGGNCPGGAFG